MNSDEIKVVGPNTSDGTLSVWHFKGDVLLAQKFAEQLARDTGEAVYVCKLIGTWKREIPVTYTSAQPANEDAAKE